MQTSSWCLLKRATTIRPLHARGIVTRSTASSKFGNARRRTVDHQQKDIVHGDLTATLEAHRRSNRAPKPIVRHVVQDEEEDAAKELPNDRALAGSETKLSAETEEQTQDLQDNESGPATTPIPRFTRSNSPSGSESSLYADIRTERPRKQSKRAPIGRPQVRYLKDFTAVELNRISEGHYVPTRSKPGDFRTPHRPWLVTNSSAQLNRDDILSLQISNLATWLALTPAEYSFRNDMVRDFSASLREEIVDVEFYLFGSHETGLSTTLSDVDVGFHIPSILKPSGQRGPSTGLGRRQVRLHVNSILHQISTSEVWRKRYVDQEVVKSAKHPLVRVCHVGSGTDIQIVASQSMKHVIAYICDCLEEFPQLKPIFLLLKSALKARALTDPKLGGIGSYPLLVLLFVCLKRKRIMRRHSIAEALQAIFHSCNDLDTRTTGLTAEYPYTFHKHFENERPGAAEKAAMEADSALWARRQLAVKRDPGDFLLCLQDPNDPTNDLGNGAWRILDILATMRDLGEKVTAFLSRPGPLGSVQLMDTMIGDTCTVVKDKRIYFARWATSPAGQMELRKMQSRLQLSRETKVTKDTREMIHFTDHTGNEAVDGEKTKEKEVVDLDAMVDRILGDKMLRNGPVR